VDTHAHTHDCTTGTTTEVSNNTVQNDVVPVVCVEEHETERHCGARTSDIDVHTLAFLDLITRRLVALAARASLHITAHVQNYCYRKQLSDFS